MSASAGSLPLLVSRFLEAHRSSDIPAFSLENALIVSLDCGGDQPLLHSFHVANNSATPAAPPLPLNHSPFKDLFDTGLDAVLPAESLFPLLPSGWEGAQEIQVIPLALLCSPVGFLLAPLPDGEEHAQRFQGFIHLLYGFVRDCLAEDLLLVFNRANAHQYASETELLCSLAKTAAQWLAPSRYRITNGDGSLVEERKFFPKASEDADQFEFPVIGDAGQYKVVFHLPGLLLNGGESPGPLHLTRPYQLRKFKCSISIPRLFSRILEDWAYPVSLPQSILRQMEDIHRKTGELIRAAGKPAFTHPQVPAREEPPFCFYRKGVNTWVIRFDGENALPDTKEQSNKGMEVIRILLGMPEEHFDTLFLDEYLNKSGDNNKTKGSDTSKYDPDLDRSKEKMFFEEWEELREYEKDIDLISKEHQLAYWRKRFGLVKLLLKFRYKAIYIRDWKKCSKMIKKLLIEVDENFTDYSEEAFTPNPDIKYNYRNRLEAIRKAIYKALGILGADSPIHQYLEATIICKKKGNFEPFSYEPLLAPPGSPAPIYWETSPPSEEE